MPPTSQFHALGLFLGSLLGFSQSLMQVVTRDEWCDVFTNKQACVTPVLSLMEVPNHSHHLERQAFVEVDGVPQPAPAPRFSRTPGRAGPISKRGGGAKVALLRWGLKADDPMFKKLSSDL